MGWGLGWRWALRGVCGVCFIRHKVEGMCIACARRHKGKENTHNVR